MGMTKEFDLADDGSTRRLGAAISRILEPGDVVALYGNLGAGKTTLARGLLQALCDENEEVPSPTYTLVQAYESRAFPIWHYDLYRLELPDDLGDLGWEDTVDGVCLVEWPDKAGGRLARWRLNVFLEISGDHRKATLEPLGEHWQERLDGFRL